MMDNIILSEEQKEEYKRMGEEFYGNIDMDKYKPIPTEDGRVETTVGITDPELIAYGRLLKAIESGLLVEDFTDEEMEIYKKYSK